MKGFIKITRLNGEPLLINVSKIRTINPSIDGCAIFPDDSYIIRDLEGSFNYSSSVNNIKIECAYENVPIIAKEGFEEVCALIEAAQS